MNKKRIGAALSLVAAVSAGATAYASTINNLESDKNTNYIFAPDYSANTHDYNFVDSDYTEDLKNTAIANETRTVKNTAKQEETVAKVEKNAKDILQSTVINVVAKENKENKEDIEEKAFEEDALEDTTEKEDTELDKEVIAYDDSKLLDVEETEADQDDYLENQASSEESEQVDTEKESNEVLAYDDTNLDANLNENSEDLEVAEEENQGVNYLDDNSNELETKEEVATSETKYVNTESLFIRSAKSMDDDSNIINTLAAGDKVEGTIEGDWLKTNDGYLNLKYLSNSYPQKLIDSIKARKLEEVKKVEEAKKALELKKSEANKEESNQVKKEENSNQQDQYGTAFTGWVYNTEAINVRDKAKTGNVVGTLAKGSKVEGEIADGWVKINYNGKAAFVSAYYITNEEISAESQAQDQPAKEQAVEETPVAEENNNNNNQKQENQQEEAVVEQVIDEEEIVQEEETAPVINQNGQQAANIASQFAGSPYVWGASNPSVGFDCSGLVAYAYRQLGVNLPHSSQAQFNNGYAVGINNLQAGDLVFFSNNSGIDHVGIVTSSDGTFIHASTPKSGVRYDNVYSSYYQKVFAGARRIF